MDNLERAKALSVRTANNERKRRNKAYQKQLENAVRASKVTFANNTWESVLKSNGINGTNGNVVYSLSRTNFERLFDVHKVPGDGACGIRSLLASRNVNKGRNGVNDQNSNWRLDTILQWYKHLKIPVGTRMRNWEWLYNDQLQNLVNTLPPSYGFDRRSNVIVFKKQNERYLIRLPHKPIHLNSEPILVHFSGGNHYDLITFKRSYDAPEIWKAFLRKIKESTLYQTIFGNVDNGLD